MRCCWTRRLVGSASPAGTSGCYTPRRGNVTSRSLSCDGIPSKRRFSSATGCARVQPRKLWSRCIWPEFTSADWRILRKRSWGAQVSRSMASSLNQKIYVKVEASRNRRNEGEHLYLNGIVMKRAWTGEVRNTPFWWPARSMPMVFGRFRASAISPRHTSPVVRPSCPIWGIEVLNPFSRLFPTPAAGVGQERCRVPTRGGLSTLLGNTSTAVFAVG